MAGGVGGIGVSPGSNQTQTADAKQALPAGVTVHSHGQKVESQPNTASLIEQAQQDSREEMMSSLSDKLADKLKQRDAKSRSASRINEILQKYMQGVGSVTKPEKFQELANSLKKLSNATPDQIREMIQSHKEGTGDDNFESALLLALEESFAADGSNEQLLAAIREVKQELGQQLQDFYQNQVKTYGDVNDAYKEIIGEHKEEDFLKATGSLITKLGQDLQAQGSSVDSNRIKSTVDTLYNLEVAKNTFTSLATLVDKLESIFTVKLPK